MRHDPDERHRALLGVLVAHQVRFVLVGGVALQLHGFSGATRDVDVTIAADPANGRRLESALTALRARPYLAGERGSAYVTDLGQLEVMRWTHGVGDYDAWTHHASTVELEAGLRVLVGSPSDLLLAKEQAARDKDLGALPRLRAELIASGALDAQHVRGPVAELPRDVPLDPRVGQVLGPRPTGRRARGLWDRGAQLVAEYRERWEIVDDSPPLGPPPAEGRAQAKDRQALERQLQRLRRLLERAGGPPGTEQ